MSETCAYSEIKNRCLTTNGLWITPSEGYSIRWKRVVGFIISGHEGNLKIANPYFAQHEHVDKYLAETGEIIKMEYTHGDFSKDVTHLMHHPRLHYFTITDWVDDLTTETLVQLCDLATIAIQDDHYPWNVTAEKFDFFNCAGFPSMLSGGRHIVIVPPEVNALMNLS